MQTPIPAQLEQWIKLATNKKAPPDLRQHAILHLSNIRDIIDKSIKNNSGRSSNKNENLYTRRHTLRS